MTNYQDIIGKRERKYRIYDIGVMFYDCIVGTSCPAVLVNGEWKNCTETAVQMDYTGLEDKNGTNIFEGDIVQYLCQKETTQVLQTYVVVFHYDSFCKLMDGEHYAFGFSKNGQLLKEKVIGNVFQNPDLLIPTQS